jgi:hypothetical protein
MPDAITIRRLATPAAILPMAALLAVTACGERDADARDSDKRVAAVSASDVWHEGPRLPQPITNNAVAAASVDGRTAVYTFLGLDSTKTWSGVTSSAYQWYVGDDAWTSIEPVPGPGRLAATAQMIGDRIYVLGGYTVAEDGSERSLPDVAVYDPAAGTWTRGADIPVPVDDAVSGIWRGRIFLVSGWHDTGNVAHVQVYDPDADRWSEASPVSGSPVFGHTGAVVGDHVAYVDGAAVVNARPRFRIDVASWLGTIDRDGGTITWRPAAPHPGPPLYRAAGAALPTSDGGWESVQLQRNRVRRRAIQPPSSGPRILTDSQPMGPSATTSGRNDGSQDRGRGGRPRVRGRRHARGPVGQRPHLVGRDHRPPRGGVPMTRTDPSTTVEPAAPSTDRWSTSDATDLYRVDAWGEGYFSVSDQGTLLAHPSATRAQAIDLFDVVRGLAGREIGTPVIVRLPGVLEHRMRELRRAFDDAIKEAGYGAEYACVYPIKVNQERHVCEAIRDLGSELGFGLEVGSKPELIAGLALTQGFNDMPLVCNGFKDSQYIETVVLAAKMGRNILPVAEQAHELRLIAASARQHDVRPDFGIRAKLTTPGVGRWAGSAGIRGKFGLTVAEMLHAVEYLEREDLLAGLKMLHCHVGSQIFDIRVVKYVVSELAHLYVELVRAGEASGWTTTDHDPPRSRRSTTRSPNTPPTS